ncbi:hypothetical protein QWA_11297 [Alcaligenes faecalis subsp. faecalis NCIB 8687]|nr:hypothetical protein QWA_11297 [Alcaligenes faecalis subsp. faecalis NCIB 8687]
MLAAIIQVGNLTAKGRLIRYCNGPVKHKQIERVYTAYSLRMEAETVVKPVSAWSNVVFIACSLIFRCLVGSFTFKIMPQ